MDRIIFGSVWHLFNPEFARTVVHEQHRGLQHGHVGFRIARGAR